MNDGQTRMSSLLYLLKIHLRHWTHLEVKTFRQFKRTFAPDCLHDHYSNKIREWTIWLVMRSSNAPLYLIEGWQIFREHFILPYPKFKR